MLFEYDGTLLCDSQCICGRYITVHHSSMYKSHTLFTQFSSMPHIGQFIVNNIHYHQALLRQDVRLCEMTLQLKIIKGFILKRLISCCRHLRTVMSELGQLVIEKIKQIKLFGTDNAKCSVDYDFNVNSCDCCRVIRFHGCISDDHIVNYVIIKKNLR